MDAFLDLLGTGGLAVFLLYVYRSLKTKINTLEQTIDAQKETLEAVKQRADEFERLSGGYERMMNRLDDTTEKIVKWSRVEVEMIQRQYERELERLSPKGPDETKPPLPVPGILRRPSERNQ